MRNLLNSVSPVFISALMLVILATSVFVLNGCKTVPEAQSAHLIVSYATAKYIEKAGPEAAQQARAARVIAVVNTVDELAGSDGTTVDYLKAYVAQRLPADLSPADRILAGALIDEIVAMLKQKIGDGVLPPDAVTKVRDVLRWVREGAATYLPPAATT